jgi:hypothetical protein
MMPRTAPAAETYARRPIRARIQSRDESRMGLFGWFKGKGSGDSRTSEWRRAWSAAAAAPADGQVSALASSLEALGLPEEEIEIEREMLEALRDLVELRAAVESGGLPLVETGHRVIGADRCHFSAPVSMPDDAAQPSGRLLLTGARAVFIGGARTTTVPWHAVGEAIHADRDVVLIKKDRQNLYRFRCNSFTDAMCGAYLARQLAAERPSSTTRTTRTNP